MPDTTQPEQSSSEKLYNHLVALGVPVCIVNAAVESVSEQAPMDDLVLRSSPPPELTPEPTPPRKTRGYVDVHIEPTDDIDPDTAALIEQILEHGFEKSARSFLDAFTSGELKPDLAKAYRNQAPTPEPREPIKVSPNIARPAGDSTVEVTFKSTSGWEAGFYDVNRDSFFITRTGSLCVPAFWRYPKTEKTSGSATAEFYRMTDCITGSCNRKDGCRG